MSKFKTYWMWYQQSLSEQALWYSSWKKSTHSFSGRTHKEATRKMNNFLSYAEITGRFLCVEEGCEVIKNGEVGKSHIEQILESALLSEQVLETEAA